MLLYWDVTLGENSGYFADVYKIEYMEDNAICAVTTKVVSRKESVQCNTGANASEEAQDEEQGDDDTVKSGPELVLNSDGALEENIVFDKKKVLQGYLKKHLKKLGECLVKRITDLEGEDYKNPIDIECAKTTLKSFQEAMKTKTGLVKFMSLYDPDNATIYTSPDYDHETGEGTPAIGVWNEDCTAMTFYFLNHSLCEKKL